jgi:hypothetical protein
MDARMRETATIASWATCSRLIHERPETFRWNVHHRDPRWWCGRTVRADQRPPRGVAENAEILCARFADPLIAHDFETESLASSQAGHSCALEGAYIDHYVNATIVGLDETIAFMGVEPSDGSNCHSASFHEGHLVTAD